VPVEDGGLGLDPATATMVGHDDDAYLAATVYTKLAQRRAITHTQHAMDACQQRQQNAHRAHTSSPEPQAAPYAQCQHPRERRTPTPFHFQFIPEWGACYKPRSCRIIARRRPEPTEIGGAECV